jgi:hypothetical protein
MSPDEAKAKAVARLRALIADVSGADPELHCGRDCLYEAAREIAHLAALPVMFDAMSEEKEGAG